MPIDHFAPPSGKIAKPVSPAAMAANFEGKLDRVRILIAEDDFLIATQIEEALLAAGLQVVGTATTADEALDFASQERPALVIMDVRLAGGSDGIGAARELFHRFNIRCIFATANDDLHIRLRAEPYAPLGWLTKPYTMESLVVIIVDALVVLGLRSPRD
jgi:DNA-binding NarL/FixJ family response regulator